MAKNLAVQDQHLKNMQGIEREHRMKMMALEEEQLHLQVGDQARSAADNHTGTLEKMQQVGTARCSEWRGFRGW